MKTKNTKSPTGLFAVVVAAVTVALIAYAAVRIGNVSVTQGGTTSAMAHLKRSHDPCRFTLASSWTPEIRTDVAIMFRVAGTTGEPKVHISPWSISRIAPCSSEAQVRVTQSVYSNRRAGCEISVNGAIVSRHAKKSTWRFTCQW